jgi:hypothetical protein
LQTIDFGDVTVFSEETVESAKLLGGQVANHFICAVFSFLEVGLALFEFGEGIGT